jgi:hypothetical protein
MIDFVYMGEGAGVALGGGATLMIAPRFFVAEHGWVSCDGYGAILLGGISFIGLVLVLAVRSVKSPNK